MAEASASMTSVITPMVDALRCPICTNLINLASQTPCGHSACKDCLVATLSIKLECPMCRAPCRVEQLSRSFAIDAAVDALPFKCDLCPFVGDKSSKSKHLVTCSGQVVCPMCNDTFMRRDCHFLKCPKLLDSYDVWVNSVTANAAEFLATCSVVARNVRLNASAENIVSFIWDVDRVFTPYQIKELSTIVKNVPVPEAALKSGYRWPSILMSFVSQPAMWTAISYETRARYLDDENTACSWANSVFKHNGMRTYADALKSRNEGSTEVIVWTNIEWIRVYGKSWMDVLTQECV